MARILTTRLSFLLGILPTAMVLSACSTTGAGKPEKCASNIEAVDGVCASVKPHKGKKIAGHEGSSSSGKNEY